MKVLNQVFQNKITILIVNSKWLFFMQETDNSFWYFIKLVTLLRSEACRAVGHKEKYPPDESNQGGGGYSPPP